MTCKIQGVGFLGTTSFHYPLPGDCWFLAALGSLTQNPRCLQKILMNQSYSHQYAGIFRFRFWQCGQWVEVVVDDRLPVIGKNFLFVHPRRGNQEFWPCLMEKAYAKLLGSYSQIHYGYLPDALVDLTGGVVTIVNLHSSPSDLLMAVKTAVKAGSMVACATPKGLTDESEVMENGLVSQHAYTVTGAEKIQYQRGWEEIIRLWNPWGNTEWKGRWRDGSQEWEETHDPRKSQLYENKDDGEFWYLPVFKDFQQFQERLPPAFFSPFRSAAQGIDYVSKCNFTKSFHLSPGTYVIVPSAHRKEVEFLLRIFLKMPDKDRYRSPGFQQFQERLPPAFFSPFRSAAQGIDYVSKCNFTKSFHLSPGTYVIVPSAHRKEVEFLLRIFLKMPDKDRYRSPGGLDIDATQLQKLLNQEFLTGSPGDTFSLDQCQSIVALMDLKVNGRLDQDEFARLWSRLIHCQHVFQNFQRSPGVLLSSDLWKVIESTGNMGLKSLDDGAMGSPTSLPTADFLSGVFITNELLELMTLRYSDKSGLVSFPSLVCFLIRLETMASK
ncbi:hypothetical protein A6R68_21244 [Neotoma lepida]|uniref:Calpain catalytic domain-containing protein n=1 Tax=Neotoma lepida TaxID=56216 RepID=A0A1A6HQ21_NEOLE|nr:hypothetical protein A6R68_21244 [Neotoma lepida]